MARLDISEFREIVRETYYTTVNLFVQFLSTSKVTVRFIFDGYFNRYVIIAFEIYPSFDVIPFNVIIDLWVIHRAPIPMGLSLTSLQYNCASV